MTAFVVLAERRKPAETASIPKGLLHPALRCLAKLPSICPPENVVRSARRRCSIRDKCNNQGPREPQNTINCFLICQCPGLLDEFASLLPEIGIHRPLANSMGPLHLGARLGSDLPATKLA